MTDAQRRHIRAKLAEAHAYVREAIAEPGNSPAEEALIGAIEALAMVTATLCEVLETPLTDAEVHARVTEGG